jgi:hypothetical protein
VPSDTVVEGKHQRHIYHGQHNFSAHFRRP